MPLTLVLLPVLTGLGLWAARSSNRLALGGVAALALTSTLAIAIAAALSQPALRLRWGADLDLELGVAAVARLPVMLVPLVALAVAVYAAAHEEQRGLGRLIGLLVAFVGAMELVLVAGDFLTLLIGWELVGAISWGLISHHWRSDAPGYGAHAFNTTRFGDLGLFVAAGAVFAATGSLSFSAAETTTGAAASALAAGVLVAAFAKSAQVPFAPWLFSAMAGPTSVSALLHSATMVAAGAYLLARLQPVLDQVAWFAAAAVTVGLLTALAGGVVAALQPDAKKLLAASTSAQYGLMIVAVGAGYPAVAIAHLVAHGLFKALLFLAAGVAIGAAGTGELRRMGLGRTLRATAWLAAVGSLALAAVPPLGAAWTKEKIVGAAVHAAPAIGWLVLAAGALSAFYAARFQLLAFSAPRDRYSPPAERPGWPEHAAMALLAAVSAVLGTLWLPVGEDAARALTTGQLPAGALWELVASLAGVALGGYAALELYRRRRLAWPGLPGSAAGRAADWLAIPTLTRLALVAPSLALAHHAARFDDVAIDGAVRGIGVAGRRVARVLGRGDDRVVDAGIRGIAKLAAWTARVLDRAAEVGFDGAAKGIARLVGTAGRDIRRLQTGQAHHYYAMVAIGAAVLVVAAAFWR